MSTLTKTLGTVTLALVGMAVQAEDFSSLMQVAKGTWPEKTHLGVICDYRNSKDQVEDLARAAGPNAMITVVDVHRLDQALVGAQLLANRKTQYMVLLPGDPIIRDGSYGATLAISRLANYGIPSVGTSPKAIGQGAVFSLGDGTNGEVLVTNRLKGTVDVILPEGISFSRRASLSLSEGMASIEVFAQN